MIIIRIDRSIIRKEYPKYGQLSQFGQNDRNTKRYDKIFRIPKLFIYSLGAISPERFSLYLKQGQAFLRLYIEFMEGRGGR